MKPVAAGLALSTVVEYLCRVLNSRKVFSFFVFTCSIIHNFNALWYIVDHTKIEHFVLPIFDWLNWDNNTQIFRSNVHFLGLKKDLDCF